MTAGAQNPPLATYQALLDEGALSADEGQKLVVQALDGLYHNLITDAPTPSFLGRLRKAKQRPAPNGLYIYGGVGRGKSRLMDMFYHCLPEGFGRRVHFHDFMVLAHDAMNDARAKGAEDPIIAGAQMLMKSKHKVLCFDEMEVRDIADAMIVQRLFDALFSLNITVIATSNRHPDELYKGGLHRDRFLPFIAKVKDHCDILQIADGADWRARLLGQSPRWYVPCGARAHDKMIQQFEMVTSAGELEMVCVKVAGREIMLDKVAHNIAFTSFDALCSVPLAARDYVAIADRLTGLFITDIPQLGDAAQNEARRFMWLIDALYDRGRFVVASAEVDMQSLYTGQVWAFEFDRTLSRLSEMTRQS